MRYFLTARFLSLIAVFLAASLTLAELKNPRLKIPTLSGSHFDLEQERGKVVALVFFATWCEGCEAKLQEMNSLLKKYHSRGFEILALSLDRPRDKKKVTEFMKAYDFPGALFSDSEERTVGAPNSIPAALLIDRKGAARFTSQTPESDLIQLLQEK